ncbi:SAM-dependent methyltransferase [Arenimonas soli]|uniref:SAM-dependent methyltransferase n=1 Tax=Arenimonas soli TaxID=2269504 RepID=A0ABQ1HP99_9GAMM|nr:class I SAM-dependent methyltransferase [Arenimonas soli]GGA85078.1 SAM-dependent methyltransferase [Arenimonas soli]
MKCRACSQPLERVFLDLGTAPPSNAYLQAADLARPESWLPLKLHTCDACLLVQVDEVERHDLLFSAEYAYFSSYSRSWLEHAERYVDTAVARLGLGPRHCVVELASNDGYLLQYVAARGIPCLGIEPTESTARVARERGIETITEFFGETFARQLREERGSADLVIGNNVLAHVPDINDFVAGIAALIGPEGVATLEFPHLLELVGKRQFDTVYHEHFSYLSLHVVRRIFAAHGLRVWDVESLPTHGGSLRVWACREQASHADCAAVEAMAATERAAGMLEPAWYDGFQRQAEAVKDDFLAFLLEQKRAGRKVAGYGAAAKGNTLMNFAGVRADLVAFVADASPHKQGRYLPGSRIPVVSPQRLIDERPDFVVVFPWNLYDEISTQMACVRDWGGRFVRAVPSLVVS